MNRLGPIAGRQLLRLATALFQFLNQVEQRIHRAVLACRAVLIHDGMNGHRSLYARQFVTGLITAQGLDDGNRAMLAIIGMSSPPNHAEDLAGAEVVNGLPAPLFMMLDGLAQAQAIEPLAGNIAGGESG